MILKMSLAEIIVAIITMPVRQCIADHTFACRFVVIKILSGLRRLVLLLSPQSRTPHKNNKKPTQILLFHREEMYAHRRIFSFLLAAVGPT